jgi:molecular chaperone HtpG
MANDPMAKGQGMKAVKILEINPDHPVFAKLQEVNTENPDRLKDYTDVLYNQALLIAGLPIEDPAAYARKITELMIRSN